MLKQYIITIHIGVNPSSFANKLKLNNVQIDIDYDALSRMFLITIDENDKQKWKIDQDVLHIAPADAEVILHSVKQEISSNSNGMGGNWGLLRISNKTGWPNKISFPLKGVYEYSKTGKGVDVYVVDTGVRLTHTEFGGRAFGLYDGYTKVGLPTYGFDFHGHGTNVASIIAGKTYGVAKEATIYSSRIFNGSTGTLATVINGLNACLKHHISKKTGKPSIVNMSFACFGQMTEQHAIDQMIANGMVCVVAAGNDGRDLASPGYDLWPAEIDKAITVGAIDVLNKRTWFSNYGYEVDVFAPGNMILGGSHLNDSSSIVMSGTSQATPFVVGVCALYLEGKKSPSSSSEVVKVHEWIKNNSIQNQIQFLTEDVRAKSGNRILFSYYTNTANDPIEPQIVGQKQIIGTAGTNYGTNVINQYTQPIPSKSVATKMVDTKSTNQVLKSSNNVVKSNSFGQQIVKDRSDEPKDIPKIVHELEHAPDRPHDVRPELVPHDGVNPVID